MARTTEIILDGLVFPEGPRWHDDRLWFSDQHDKRVVAMTADGTPRRSSRCRSSPPGSAGYPTDGLLVVSMIDRRCSAANPTARWCCTPISSALAPGACNDMVVDATGRAYVGNFGFDMYGGEQAAPHVRHRRRARRHRAGRGRRARLPERLGDHPRRRDAPRRREHGAPDQRVRHRTPTARSRTRACGRSSTGATVDGICLDAEGAFGSRRRSRGVCCESRRRRRSSTPSRARIPARSRACSAAPTDGRSTSAARRPTSPRSAWPHARGASRPSRSTYRARVYPDGSLLTGPHCRHIATRRPRRAPEQTAGSPAGRGRPTGRRSRRARSARRSRGGSPRCGSCPEPCSSSEWKSRVSPGCIST